MGMLLGPFDPLQLVFNMLNNMLKKGLISYSEAREIIKSSLDPKMSEEDKEKLLDSLIQRNP